MVAVGHKRKEVAFDESYVKRHESIVPPNTQKARSTAVSAFARFLEGEGVTLEYVHASIQRDTSGDRLAAVMDRFGYHLALGERKGGKPLSNNSAISYYRQVKLWLLTQHPQLRLITEHEFLKKGKTLEKHCMKREAGGYISKAPACTKEDLSMLMAHVYSTATSSKDYQDGALACLMWHSFGRVSDLGFVQKQHVSVSAEGIFYLRILRVKTVQEPGLTLVPEKRGFFTCPLFSLASALVMQEAPCAALLSQLPSLITPSIIASDPGIPLSVVLASRPEATVSAPVSAPATSSMVTGSEIGIHGYMNRFLKRVPLPDHATRNLTSHSFRRGGAQHANGDEKLAPQWIFDCGAWNLSTTNKAFAYVFNTPREDRKVARVLSGWEPDTVPIVVDVAALDRGTQEKLRRLQAVLFCSCVGFADLSEY